MNAQNPIDALKLHDIKGIVPVPDDSLYYLIAAASAAAVLLAVLLYLIWRYLGRKRPENLQKRYREALHAIVLDNAKEAAYAITYYAERLEKDAPQQKAFEDLSALLESYKYKKEVEPLSEEVRREFEYFKGLF